MKKLIASLLLGSALVTPAAHAVPDHIAFRFGEFITESDSRKQLARKYLNMCDREWLPSTCVALRRHYKSQGWY